MLALAVVHHLCLARNVPLLECLRRLVRLAPRGIIEFVPKDDPMVQQLLQFREDIFPEYTQEQFLARLGSIAQITQTATVSTSGRVLVEFSR